MFGVQSQVAGANGRRGLRRLSRPLCVSVAIAATLLLCGTKALAQDPMRPWLRWRTMETPNYRFHYLPELEEMTRDVARKVEMVDSAITALVGYATPKPVHVVINDPLTIANGYALPFIDKPVSVWWATPPDPRNDIGNYHTWGEMLAVHELTHLAHLTRPSRNPRDRQLWAGLSANLGPITRRTPRWLYEGYATVIEGRITGTGRPNNVWRPAILRQWAIEGRLPTYAQLANWGDFNGGEFAYLGGSAFLEWLMQREGDSSLVSVWRRLTARQVRSFDAAFAGVYGDAPAVLYGRHAAELTRDAMAVQAALERAGLISGELVQRLSWATGDPAISPDGKRVAIVLRDRNRPARLVVWRSGQEAEDTAAVRKRLDALKKDPLDVADRRFVPLTKRAEKRLLALNGRSYQMPRWFADNRRVLTTRWTQRSDGTLTPGLYVWDTESGDVRAVPRSAGVLHGDPHPTRNDAVAMRCRWGHCDIARVDLGRGTVTTLLAGDARTSYYRPRYAPDGSRFVASVSRGGRWDIVVSNDDGSGTRHVGPDDGANRYDAQWVGNDSLVVVSERGGIANLEILSVRDRGTRALTRITGAAVGPDVNRADGSIWFLSMHSLGYDVRRLPRRATIADSVVIASAERFGFAAARTARPRELPERPVGAPTPYGAGPRHQRWFPGGYASADGAGAFVTVFSGDIIGRFNAAVTGAFGEVGTWQAGSLRFAWRFPRPTIEFGGHAFIHEPSQGRRGLPAADSIDAALGQGLFAVALDRLGEGWRWRARAGGGAGPLEPTLGPRQFRGLGFAELDLQMLQSRGGNGLTEHVWVHTAHGQARAPFQRTVGSLQVGTVGPDAAPLEVRVTFGRLSGSAHPFERFAVGGADSPAGDSSLMAQRYAMPLLPTGVAIGNTLLAWRVAFPSSWTVFYEGAATAPNSYTFRTWNRAVGVETSFSLAAVPVAFAPRMEMRGGAGYTLDAPFRRRVRAYLQMKMEP